MIGDSTPLRRQLDYAYGFGGAHAMPAWYTIIDYITDTYEADAAPLRAPQAVVVGIDTTDKMTRSEIDAMYRQAAIASYLPHADFTILNDTYHTRSDHDCCATCNGRSGTVTTEWQGEPHYGAPVNFFDPCADCLGAGLCPGCMQPLALSFDQSAMPDYHYRVQHIERYNTDQSTTVADHYTRDGYNDAISALPFEGFICLVCGWQYDADRFAPSEDDYDDYDDGYGDDYPALDASDIFGY
jgi:hypothetical protein